MLMHIMLLEGLTSDFASPNCMYAIKHAAYTLHIATGSCK